VQISETAASRLAQLSEGLISATGGLRFEGYIGTCRGSAPVLKPVDGPEEGDRLFEVKGIRFYVPAENEEVFETATMDVERSFMGRGLFLSWPHRAGCDCECK
jgi:Fe-S cluster assembly iron-binding protein IscA